MAVFTITLNPRSLSPNRMEGPPVSQGIVPRPVLSICLAATFCSGISSYDRNLGLRGFSFPQALLTFHPEAWLRDRAREISVFGAIAVVFRHVNARTTAGRLHSRPLVSATQNREHPRIPVLSPYLISLRGNHIYENDLT